MRAVVISLKTRMETRINRSAKKHLLPKWGVILRGLPENNILLGATAKSTFAYHSVNLDFSFISSQF